METSLLLVEFALNDAEVDGIDNQVFELAQTLYVEVLEESVVVENLMGIVFVRVNLRCDSSCNSVTYPSRASHGHD
jgi:hypothetical protein